MDNDSDPVDDVWILNVNSLTWDKVSSAICINVAYQASGPPWEQWCEFLYIFRQVASLLTIMHWKFNLPAD